MVAKTLLVFNLDFLFSKSHYFLVGGFRGRRDIFPRNSVMASPYDPPLEGHDFPNDPMSLLNNDIIYGWGLGWGIRCFYYYSNLRRLSCKQNKRETIKKIFWQVAKEGIHCKSEALKHNKPTSLLSIFMPLLHVCTQSQYDEWESIIIAYQVASFTSL